MSWKDHDLPKYDTSFWKPEQVISYYQEHDVALNRTSLLHHLLNQFGTSFLRVSSEGMAEQFHLFHGHEDEYSLVHLAHTPHNFFASVLPPGFNPTHIYEYMTVRPDELMVQFDRYDDVFRDANEDVKAYSHLARQALLFKKGVLVDGVAISTLYYKLPSGHGRLHTVLSEGLHEVQFFTNPDVKPLAMVDPMKQVFDQTKSYTSLSIGPKFSFSAARYKRPDRRESQPGYMPGIYGLSRRFIRGK